MPRCGRPSSKVHDRRVQRKRDVPLRGRRVRLVLRLWRSHCLWCMGRRYGPRTFGEMDPASGQGPKERFQPWHDSPDRARARRELSTWEQMIRDRGCRDAWRSLPKDRCWEADVKKRFSATSTAGSPTATSKAGTTRQTASASGLRVSQAVERALPHLAPC